MTKTPPIEQGFEEAFARLELILTQMQSNSVSLDEALKLYEEADKLIILCTRKLTDAEKRIEFLKKNRDGSLELSDEQKPITQDYIPGK